MDASRQRRGWAGGGEEPNRDRGFLICVGNEMWEVFKPEAPSTKPAVEPDEVSEMMQSVLEVRASKRRCNAKVFGE